MTKTSWILILMIFVIIFGVFALYHSSNPVVNSITPNGAPGATSTAAMSADESAVTGVVLNFGKKMQDVSLLAPSSTAAQAINDNYETFVSPDLLSKWMGDPSNAPGRLTSSPWPDHITISSITQIDANTYTVLGRVIELTSNEVQYGGVAGTYSVTLTVERQSDGRWLITNWQDTLQRGS